MRISQITPEMLEADVQGDGDANDAWKDYLNSMMAAIIGFDEDRLEEIYNGALSLYPIGVVTSRLLTPLLVELGLRWESGQGGIGDHLDVGQAGAVVQLEEGDPLAAAGGAHPPLDHHPVEIALRVEDVLHGAPQARHVADVVVSVWGRVPSASSASRTTRWGPSAT